MTRLERQRRKLFLERRLLLLITVIFAICFMAWKYIEIYTAVVPVSRTTSMQKENKLIALPNLKELLFLGIPGLDAGNKQAVNIRNEISAQEVARNVVMFFTSIDIKDVRSLFNAEIPILSAIKPQMATVSAMSLPNFPKFENASAYIGDGKPLVAIYHTHTSEAFIPSFGAAHAPGGQRGDIVEVGAALAKRLKDYGIASVQSTTVHDYPSFMKAYSASEITAKKLLTDNPSIQMIFDIHRDAEKRENCTANINGQPVAKILIIVATGQPDLIQPHWQQNHAFAKLIDAKLNQKYPGVSRGIQLVDWRYNQHLHPRALLLEVGCQENSKEEAERSMEMLADVLNDIIKENQ